MSHMSKAEGAKLGIVITRPTWPASAVAGVAEPACYHPRSCDRCRRVGIACGRHYRGDAGHERCIGAC